MTRHRSRSLTLLVAALAWVAPRLALAQDSGGLGLDLSDDSKKDATPPKTDTPPAADNPPTDTTPAPPTDNTPAPATDNPPVDTGNPGQPAQPAANPNNNIGERDANLEDRVKSVAKRSFYKKNHFELTPQAGLTVNDPYYTKFALGAAATFHISDSLGLGLHGDYLIVQESGNVPTAKRELHSRLPVTNPDYGGLVDFEWVPIYCKASLFNTIIQFDTMILGGVGAIHSQTSSSSVSTDPRLNEGLHPAVEVGLGQRYPLNELFAFEWKLMETMYNDIPGGSGPATLERMTMFYAGLAIFLPPVRSND